MKAEPRTAAAKEAWLLSDNQGQDSAGPPTENQEQKSAGPPIGKQELKSAGPLIGNQMGLVTTLLCWAAESLRCWAAWSLDVIGGLAFLQGTA